MSQEIIIKTKDGKQFVSRVQFAELLGVRPDHLVRHLKQRQIECAKLAQRGEGRETLYPLDIVKLALVMLETKSEIGQQFKRQLAEQLLNPKELPKQEPLQLVPPKASRDQLRETVANIATELDIPYIDIWRKLWQELYYRCHVNVHQRAKNAGKRPLDVIDELKLCDVSITILKTVYA
jgi:hypothetical protein